MPTTVVNMSYDQCDICIDRSTKWGNPFLIGKDGTRKEVIEKYKTWIQTQPHLMTSLPELKDKKLGCWCVPKRCHGHVLIELLKELQCI